jgi:phosphatidylglycerophosphate synthase
MRIPRRVPHLLSALRLLILPFLVVSINNSDTLLALGLFFLAAGTDLADGYLARRLNACSRFGTYWDSATDFVFIFGVFLSFYVEGIYPSFVPILLAFIFFQFIATSRFVKGIYDPVGKHYGSILYGAIGLTLLSPGTLVYGFVSAGIAIASMATLLSRALCILSSREFKKGVIRIAQGFKNRRFNTKTWPFRLKKWIGKMDGLEQFSQ